MTVGKATAQKHVVHAAPAQKVEAAKTEETKTTETPVTKPAVPDAAPVKSTATAESAQAAQARIQNDPRAQQLQAKLGAQKPAATAERTFGLSNQDGGLLSATGNIPKEAWSNPGPNIVGKLTQNSAASLPGSESAASRCAPSNILAGALMNGPEATAALLERTAGSKTSGLSDKDRSTLREIAGSVGRKDATFEQLGQAQDLLYRAGNNGMQLRESVERAEPRMNRLSPDEQTEFKKLSGDMPGWQNLEGANPKRLAELAGKANGVPGVLVPDAEQGKVVRLTPEHLAKGEGGGLDAGETLALANNVGGTAIQRDMQTAVYDASNSNRAVETVLNTLKPGQNAVILVRSARDAADPNHFVSVGKQPDGTPYVYNPNPTTGDSVLVMGKGASKAQPKDFRDALVRYSDRMAPDNQTGALPKVTISGPK